jgi:hypothetical protein
MVGAVGIELNTLRDFEPTVVKCDDRVVRKLYPAD